MPTDLCTACSSIEAHPFAAKRQDHLVGDGLPMTVQGETWMPLKCLQCGRAWLRITRHEKASIRWLPRQPTGSA